MYNYGCLIFLSTSSHSRTTSSNWLVLAVDSCTGHRVNTSLSDQGDRSHTSCMVVTTWKTGIPVHRYSICPRCTGHRTYPVHTQHPLRTQQPLHTQHTLRTQQPLHTSTHCAHSTHCANRIMVSAQLNGARSMSGHHHTSSKIKIMTDKRCVYCVCVRVYASADAVQGLRSGCGGNTPVAFLIQRQP